MLYNNKAVSYTHLDVYKRQCWKTQQNKKPLSYTKETMSSYCVNYL